jgi:nucleotidyltransferase substrate binding protein (TIGR01987 family)
MDKMDLLKTDLINAIGQLESALARKSEDPVVQAGCIQYFEFCFELAWKTIKQAVTEEGLPECYSPKSCLKKAFELKWIKNETVWLDMLEERNRVTQPYSQADALKIYGKLGQYLLEFQSLLKGWAAPA